MYSIEESVLSRVIEDLNRSGVDISTEEFKRRVPKIAHNINIGFEKINKEKNCNTTNQEVV